MTLLRSVSKLKTKTKIIEYQNLEILKGDGNDGEPDARRKLEFEKKAKIGWN